MKSVAVIVGALLLSPSFVVQSGSPLRADELPTYFKPSVGAQTSSAAEIGTKNIL